MREYSNSELPLIQIERTNNEVMIILRKTISAPASDSTEQQYEYETYSERRLWIPDFDEYEYLAKHFDDIFDKMEQHANDKKADEARAKRDKLLEACDYLMAPDYPLSTAAREQWREYRQALRDIPQQKGFPDNIEWPQKPLKKTGENSLLKRIITLEDVITSRIGGM